MKNTIKLSIGGLILAFMLMSFTSNSSAPLWVTHADTLGFKIDFPSTPTRNALLPAAGFIHDIELFQHTAGYPKYYLEVREKATAFVSVHRVLNDMVDAYAAKIKGTVIRRDAPIAWKHGIQVTAEITNAAGLHVNIRTFIKGNCSYLMAVEKIGSFAPMAEVNKFWNSLQPK